MEQTEIRKNDPPHGGDFGFFGAVSYLRTIRACKKVQFHLQNRYFKKTQEAGVYYIKKHRPWKALGSDSPYGFSSRLLLIE